MLGMFAYFYWDLLEFITLILLIFKRDNNPNHRNNLIQTILKEEDSKSNFNCFIETDYLQNSQEEINKKIKIILFNQTLINKAFKWLKSIAILCFNRQIS